jgi:hypothetical protein
MLRTTAIAACVLALSGSLALAQSNNAPYGANGAAPLRDVGSPSANASDTVNGSTSSTSILSQSNKNQSAAGMPSSSYSSGMPGGQSAGTQYRYGPQQAYGGMSGDQTNPNAVCITDEYGYKYNCRGDRIGGPRR